MAVTQGAKTAKAVQKPGTATKTPARRAQNSRRTTSESAAARVDDYEDARQVLSRYCFALDSGQMEALIPLFRRDASFSVSFESGTTHPGRAAIRGWSEKFFGQQSSQLRFMRQKIYEPELTVAGSKATSAAYFDTE